MSHNTRGGKAYKKGKGDQGASREAFIDALPDQYIARAIRILGDRNILCYCHDNVVRICHVCRRMKGREWVEQGDIVLVSIRDFSSLTDDPNPKKISRGDILAKYIPEQVRHLKKEGMNKRLFMKLETAGVITMQHVGKDMGGQRLDFEMEGDDGFDFESGSEEEDEEEDEGAEGDETRIVTKKDKKSHGRGEREVRDETAILASEKADDNVNIDDL